MTSIHVTATDPAHAYAVLRRAGIDLDLSVARGSAPVRCLHPVLALAQRVADAPAGGVDLHVRAAMADLRPHAELLATLLGQRRAPVEDVRRFLVSLDDAVELLGEAMSPPVPAMAA